MNASRTIAATVVTLCAFVAGALHAQSRTWVRGTVVSLQGDQLAVKSRDGRDLTVRLAPNAGVRAARAITLADIKPGDLVGPASRKREDGSLVAISLQLFPPERRGAIPEGHFPWDLEPGAMMTNATITGLVQKANGRELSVEYKGGAQTIVVPEGIPMFTTVPGDRSLLVPGAYVSLGAQIGADGALSAAAVTVSKDGVRPAN